MPEIPATVLGLHDIAPAPARCVEGMDWRPVRDALGMNAYAGAAPGTFEVSAWERRQRDAGRGA